MAHGEARQVLGNLELLMVDEHGLAGWAATAMRAGDGARSPHGPEHIHAHDATGWRRARVVNALHSRALAQIPLLLYILPHSCPGALHVYLT